jgi:hypothetical protein
MNSEMTSRISNKKFLTLNKSEMNSEMTSRISNKKFLTLNKSEMNSEMTSQDLIHISWPRISQKRTQK